MKMICNCFLQSIERLQTYCKMDMLCVSQLDGWARANARLKSASGAFPTQKEQPINVNNNYAALVACLDLPLRETSSSTRFSKFCMSGGRRPISLSLRPSFLRRFNLKKFCKRKSERERNKINSWLRQRHDTMQQSLSLVFGKQRPQSLGRVSVHLRVRFRGHKFRRVCHL